MISLEFIENFIKHVEEEIERFKIKIKEDVKYPSLVECHKLELDSAIKTKEILKQIKAELEAWEVVKIYTDTSDDTVNTEYYFIKGMDSEFEILKKALEIKDE